jgi:membrane associated rhomboid family serine protease
MFNTKDKETRKNIITTVLIIACVIIWITIQLFPEFPMK